ncbi:hypothetical protein [Streptomyces erythrochromogenes]|uniref:hypothetical protein n=1 Tax=Streptomyces erythrochromogenes TaxID=285574 RepID=UPI00382D335D
MPPPLLDGLRAAALLEGCRLAVPEARHTETVLGLVHDSEHREAMDPVMWAETAAWTHSGTPEGQVRPDGIPAHAFGPEQSGRGGAVRDFGRSQTVPGREWAAFERRPGARRRGELFAPSRVPYRSGPDACESVVPR